MTASCVDFGSSGSGVVREIKSNTSPYNVNVAGEEVEDGDRFVGNKKKISLLLVSYFRPAYQYSFVGPLSLSKGCDYAMGLNRNNLDYTQDISPILDYAYRGLEKPFSILITFHCIVKERTRQ